ISYNSDIVSTSRETLEKFISNSFENCICIIYVKTTTITYGSILMMKVRKVKKDPNDLSLSIPSAILPGLNADFDGDVLNDLVLTMEEFWEMFDQFSPVNMLIDRTSSTIRLDLSAMENISTAILSDM
ncbi:MAG: hypothetical protein K2J67_03945, partial [Lachnospiraceae bacterium]|nr:hypothetical protein [Lachnospiraceae bacterium]